MKSIKLMIKSLSLAVLLSQSVAQAGIWENITNFFGNRNNTIACATIAMGSCILGVWAYNNFFTDKQKPSDGQKKQTKDTVNDKRSWVEEAIVNYQYERFDKLIELNANVRFRAGELIWELIHKYKNGDKVKDMINKLVEAMVKQGMTIKEIEEDYSRVKEVRRSKPWSNVVENEKFFDFLTKLYTADPVKGESQSNSTNATNSCNN